MNDMYKDVAEFHKKFNIPVAGTEPCRIPDYLILEYRTKFLEEELNEFKLAAAQGNLTEMLDALADIAWVALGTAHYFRAPFDQVWNEVKRANMERVMATPETCPPDKRYRKDMVMKPHDWVPPRIQAVVAAHNKEIKQRPYWDKVFSDCVAPPPGQRDEITLDEGAFGGELDPYSPGAQREVVGITDVKLPIVGVINVDNPSDPRHKELLNIPDLKHPSVEDKHEIDCTCPLCVGSCGSVPNDDNN